jgi:hypothetical protein
MQKDVKKMQHLRTIRYSRWRVNFGIGAKQRGGDPVYGSIASDKSSRGPTAIRDDNINAGAGVSLKPRLSRSPVEKVGAGDGDEVFVRGLIDDLKPVLQQAEPFVQSFIPLARGRLRAIIRKSRV